MPNIHRVGSLEIDEDQEFQEKTWRLQRGGWVVIALTVLAALSGLLGPGPLSTAVTGSDQQPLTLRYDRFVRYEAPTTLQVTIRLGGGTGSEVRLGMSPAYVQRMRVRQIMPSPLRVEAGVDRVVYVFAPAGSPGTMGVTFWLEPTTFGSLPASLWLEGGEPLNFHQFIYP